MFGILEGAQIFKLKFEYNNIYGNLLKRIIVKKIMKKSCFVTILILLLSVSAFQAQTLKRTKIICKKKLQKDHRPKRKIFPKFSLSE